MSWITARDITEFINEMLSPLGEIEQLSIDMVDADDKEDRERILTNIQKCIDNINARV
jgi:hypothetical protein